MMPRGTREHKPAKREPFINDSEDDEVDEAPATSSTSWCKWTDGFFLFYRQMSGCFSISPVCGVLVRTMTCKLVITGLTSIHSSTDGGDNNILEIHQQLI